MASGVTAKNIDRPSLWADFKSSRDAIAGMVATTSRILLRLAGLRRTGSAVPTAGLRAGRPAYAEALAGKHSAWRKDHFEERCA